MDWSGHSAVRDGVGESNRMRVVARDERFQDYLNGELASIFSHDLLNQGEVCIAIEGTKNSAIDATFSDLQVRALPDDK